MQQIQDIFGPTKRNSVELLLDKLLLHINADNLIFCGGLAIRYGLLMRNVHYNPGWEFNDIDALTKAIDDVKPSIQKDFLTYHYHDYANKTPKHSDDFYIVLIEPTTKIKIDIYSYNPYIPLDPIKVPYKNYMLTLRNIEDQLATQTLETSAVLDGAKVPPKWLSSLKTMWRVADKPKVNTYFTKKKANKFTETCEEVYAKILDYLAKHPEQIVEKPSRREVYTCPYCENKNGFTVEPMEHIYKMLGYVE